MKLKATIISLVSILVVGLTAILLYCFWPAIKGTVDNSKYYTQEELQKSYDKGFEDGCKTETELTGQVKYYKGLVDEYYIQVNTLNDEITMLTKNKKDYETQITSLETQKTNLQSQVDNLTTIKSNNETTIASLNNQITSLQNQVANLTNSGEDKSEQIAILNNQIINLQNTISQLQTTNELNTNTIASLNTQIANLNNQISEMTLISQNSQSQINALNNKITELQKSVTYYESYIASLENGEQVVATFEFDGSVYNIQIVNKGSKLAVTNPTSTTYKIFNGWTVNGESIDLNTYTINTNTKIVADVTYKYDVKFMIDETTYNSQIITKNGYATLPTNPTKDGYEFDGWSLNGVDLITDISSKQVTENTTYIAVFAKLHTVTFISDEQTISTQTIKNGEFAVAPTMQNTDYMIFNGWKLNGVIVDITSQKIFTDTIFVADITVIRVLNKNFLSEITSMNSEVTRSSIYTISFKNTTDKTNKLGTLSSGIDVYYSISGSLYNLDFVADKICAPTSCSDLFLSFSKLTTIDFSNFDTSNVTDMSCMFYGCKKLYNLDLSIFDTSNVTNMSEMFSRCEYLKHLNFGNFYTSNVTDMHDMFYYCCSLVSLDLSSFNTSNVVDMSDMFNYCVQLKSLDLRNFDTRNVTNMNDMFYAVPSSSNITVGLNYTLDNLPNY